MVFLADHLRHDRHWKPLVLMGSEAVKNLIREGKTHQIQSMIQTGKKYGMQLLDDAIMDLYKRGWISADELCAGVEAGMVAACG